MFTLEDIGVDTKNYELTHKLAKALRSAHEQLGLKIEKKKIPKYFYPINHYHDGLKIPAKQVVMWHGTHAENDYVIKTLDEAIEMYIIYPITKGWTTSTIFTPYIDGEMDV